MKKVVIIRSGNSEKQTLGNLFVIENNEVLFSCKTLELPYLNNACNISSIPQGKYELILEYSPKFQRNLWSVENVPGRKGIRMHVGNYFTQIEGCILLGRDLFDINKDGELDVTSSGPTLTQFHDIMGDEPAEIIIKQI